MPPRESPSNTEHADHAIIIGIEQYVDKGVVRLEGARSDARRFYDWVTSRKGGRVNTRNVILIAPATRTSRMARVRDLERAFIALCRRAGDKAYIGRRLYIYLAGHGIAQNRDEASLFASDGGPSAPNRHIPGWSYASWFIYAAYFKQVVLIADCCRTSYRELPVRPFPIAEVPSPSAGNVLYVKGLAVKYGHSALELEAQQSRGVFTSALLDALRNAYQGGKVTARSIEAYLHNHPELKKIRDLQEPSFVSEGEVVFAEKDPAHVSTIPHRLHMKTIITPTVEGGPRHGPWPVRRSARAHQFAVDLPVGLYVVKVRGKAEGYFEVSGERGGTRDVWFDK